MFAMHYYLIYCLELLKKLDFLLKLQIIKYQDHWYYEKSTFYNKQKKLSFLPISYFVFSNKGNKHLLLEQIDVSIKFFKNKKTKILTYDFFIITKNIQKKNWYILYAWLLCIFWKMFWKVYTSFFIFKKSNLMYIKQYFRVVKFKFKLCVYAYESFKIVFIVTTHILYLSNWLI